MELFLSHATADAQLVGLITSRLSPLGVSVYAAEHDNQAGGNVHAKIGTAMSRADLIVVLLTEAGYDSVYVHQEIGFALRERKMTIPLVTSKAVKNGLGMLEGLEYIRVDEDDPGRALDSLSQRVGVIVAQRKAQNELVLAGLTLIALSVVVLALAE